MSYELIKSSHFSKKASKLLKLHPDYITIFRQKLTALSENPFSAQLRTHRLKGQLDGSYACSLSYGHRIIFKILDNFLIEGESKNIILLETIGTHDEVY